jgi:hypothetical protein
LTLTVVVDDNGCGCSGQAAAKAKNMAAKKKPIHRAPADEAIEHSTSGLHLRATQHREELIEEARSLMAAGRVREARAMQKRAGQVEQLLGALETESDEMTRARV